MSEWKKLALGFGIFVGLAFIGDEYMMNQNTKEAQAQAQAQPQVVVEKSSTLSDYAVVENFSLMIGERANVWLEGETVVFFEGSVVYVSNKSESMTFSEAGNYMILQKR